MNIGICVGLTAAAVIWMGPAPSVGYLKRVGPAPLRFLPPPKAPSELAPLLPPLAMKDPEPPPAEFFGPPIDTNAVPVVETPAPAPVVTPTVPMEPVFTPQMFLQYFNDRNGTNRDLNVVVPYQFMPPQAPTIPAPPSRATYILK